MMVEWIINLTKNLYQKFIQQQQQQQQQQQWLQKGGKMTEKKSI